MPKAVSLSALSYNDSKFVGGEHVSTFPLKEWSDSEVNEEHWDEPWTKEKPITNLIKPTLFTDYQTVHLPKSLSSMEWRRPQEVYPGREQVIYNERTFCPDLTSLNKHLLESEFMRHFVSSIGTIWFLDLAGHFTSEFTSPGFTDQPWRPWLHIYSKQKPGKNAQQECVANKVGKYIVRLFWMGTWRKIYVDDMLPVDNEGQVMLPLVEITSLSTKKSKSEGVGKFSRKSVILTDIYKPPEIVLEMWPFLLCKALLKLASLTWYDGNELVDFDIIQCLTGWLPYKVFTKCRSFNEVWSLCVKYTDEYEWPEDVSDLELFDQEQDDAQKGKHKKYVVMACYQIPQWNHHFLIHQTRNKPFFKPSRPSDFPQWKRYRWINWAASQGLIPPLEPTTPIQSLNVFDIFHAIYQSDEEDASTTARYSTPLIYIYGPLVKFQPKKAKLRHKAISFSSLMPNNFWIDFEKLSENMKYLVIYFKPFCAHSRYSVCESFSRAYLREARSKFKFREERSKFAWKPIPYSLKLKPQRNEPLYIFSDSLFSTTLLFNLSQTGYLKELEPVKDEEKATNPDTKECGICLTTLLERYRKKKEELLQVQSVEKDNIYYKPNHPRFQTSLIVGKFFWYSTKVDEYITTLTTYGSSSMILNLPPGRHIFKVYLKSALPYHFFLTSNDFIYLGDQYTVLDQMQQEPYLLKNTCYNISKSVEQLVQSFGKDNFVENLRTFYKSIHPENTLSKRDVHNFYEVFMNELLTLVRDYLGLESENHVKILFRRWQLPLRQLCSKSTLDFCFGLDQANDELVEELQRAAQKIQSFFRSLHERFLLDCHKPSSKKFKKIQENLNAVNSEIFANKSTKLFYLFRKLLQEPILEDVTQLYPFYNQMADTLKVVEVYEQSSKVSLPGWVVLGRHSFIVELPIIVRVHVICDLPQYYVRAFNNDCNDEMKYLANDLVVQEYVPNNQGYTVMCYGYTNESQIYTYKMTLMSQKIQAEPCIRMIFSQQKQDQIAGLYIPNVENIIARCVILTYSVNTVATIIFKASFEKAKIHLKVMNQTGQICKEIVGIGDVIIPVVIMENDVGSKFKKEELMKKFVRKSRSPKRIRKSLTELVDPEGVPGRYIIEATVLDDSWPLTGFEWKIVSKVKAEKLYRFRKEVDKSPRKRQSTFDSSYWQLEVVTSIDDKTVLKRDTTRDEEIMEMKIKWFSSSPTRYKRAQNLRKNFLNANMVENVERCKDKEMKSLESKTFDLKVLPTFNLTQFSRGNIDTNDSDGNAFGINGGITLKPPRSVLSKLKAIEDFHDKSANMSKELEEIIINQKKKFNTLGQWFAKCRMESVKQMADALNLKETYVQNYWSNHEKPCEQETS